MVFVLQTRYNNQQYDVYTTSDNYGSDAKAIMTETKIGTLYGESPQPLVKNKEAMSIVRNLKATFQFTIRKPVGLKCGYVLKNLANEQYVILSDPEPENGSDQTEIIAERLNY